MFSHNTYSGRKSHARLAPGEVNQKKLTRSGRHVFNSVGAAVRSPVLD